MALKQTVMSGTIWLCVQTWPCTLSLPHPQLFLHFPSSLVGYFKPQQAPKPQTTSHGSAAAASGGPQRPRRPGALLATEPEVGGRAVTEAGMGFGWGLVWSFDWAGRFRMCPSPSLSAFPITKPHSAPECTHCCVCVHVCAVTIPLVLLCKELILVWPRAAQPLFAPQNERIINSETESSMVFSPSCFSKNV